MQTVLQFFGGLLFGLVSTAAGTKSLLALERRRPYRTANWGFVVGLCNYTIIGALIYTGSFAAVVGSLIGDWCADVMVVTRQRRLDEQEERRGVHRSDGDAPTAV